MPTAVAELIMNSHTTSVLEAHYAQITAAAAGVVTAILFGKFLCCQAIEPELMGRFGVLIRYIFVAILSKRCVRLT